MATGTARPKLLIDPEAVRAAFVSCLYTGDELRGMKKGEVPKGAVIVEGIRSRYGFHPKRLEEKRFQVKRWLKALPHSFREKSGEGWSFLQACTQENGVQWTGLHERMEQLFCLAMGLGLAKCLASREMWTALPGGMPYYSISVK